MDTLQAALGQFYFAEHDNSPPFLVQVVGWTSGAERSDAKRRYVHVRKVPLRVDQGIFGGKWDFDYEVINQYAKEITAPIKDAGLENAIIIDGAQFLRYHSNTLELKKFTSIPADAAVASAAIAVDSVSVETVDDPMHLSDDEGADDEADFAINTEYQLLNRLHKT